MSATKVAAAGGEVHRSSTDEATAKLAASGLISCSRCLTMSPPEAQGCTFCGKALSAPYKRQFLTLALRATVIPMFFGAIGFCIWLLVQGQSVASLMVH
jgi:hypothetical protein